MREALDVAFMTAATEATILIRGESGTGKGVLARAIHARSQRADGSLRHGALPEPFRRAAGKRTVRPRAGGLYRRGPRHDRQGRRGRRGHALSRRNRRPAAGPATQAPAAAARALLRARGRDPDQGQQCSHSRRHEPRPGSGNRRRAVPRGPVLPPQRDRGHRAAAARSGRPTSCPWPSTCCSSSRGKTASTLPASASRCGRRFAITPGRATSASCATPSSGP